MSVGDWVSAHRRQMEPLPELLANVCSRSCANAMYCGLDGADTNMYPRMSRRAFLPDDGLRFKFTNKKIPCSEEAILSSD
jgi:hypothetical protein